MVEREYCSKKTSQEDKLFKAVSWEPKSEDTGHMGELYGPLLNPNEFIICIVQY